MHQVPDNNARSGLAYVLAEGWRIYAKQVNAMKQH
jgi:hypothetical protein